MNNTLNNILTILMIAIASILLYPLLIVVGVPLPLPPIVEEWINPTPTPTPMSEQEHTQESSIQNGSDAANSGGNNPVVLLTRSFSTKDTTRKTLTETRQITIAYAIDAEPFSYQHNGEPKGYEIDLLHDFFRDLLDIAPNELLTETFVINWIDVEIPERVDAATWPNEGHTGKEHIDMVVGAVSGTTERCNLTSRICTKSHFTDYAALLVKSDSPIYDFCSQGLEKQNIVFQTATTPGEDAETATTPEENAEAEIGSENFSSECPEHITYGEKQGRFYKEELVEAVLNNEDGIVAYITDSIILEASRRAHSPENDLKVEGQSMNAEKYVFIMRAENDGLRDLLNDFLTENGDQWESEVKSDVLQKYPGFKLREPK